MRRRRAAVQEELDRLVAAIASVRHSAALVKAINEREQELVAIAQRLLTSEPESVPAQVTRIRQFVSERLENIRQLLYSDVAKAKAELARHVTAIEMIPESEGNSRHYIAVGEWNLLGGVDDAERVRMVAGDCNAPNALAVAFRVDLTASY